ncbi:uncharacterized protein LOC143190550 isoform X2 [Rhynchophorus ferrugineus]|uniref:uncharacterized protein LOC143190550 isoform X2 n=1 Tax=Rhynchophorus ferrugineus TaxID=354439 RepID=UPI003FCDC6F3
MADHFSYTVDNSIIIQDGNMIWNDTSQDQSSLHFMDANDTIITDGTINESYATAIDSNETQYLSILDTSEDVTLENMNLSNLSLEETGQQENINLLNNRSVESTNPPSNQDVDTSQLIVFTVDGSDDLYGIQMSLDPEGNIQKYQFKLRPTTDGNLEAMPETIELLPPEGNSSTETGDSEQLTATSSENLNAHDHPLDGYFLVQSQVSSENDIDKEIPEQALDNNGVFVKDNSQFEEIETEESLEDMTEEFIKKENNLEYNVKSDSSRELTTTIYDKQQYLQENDGFNEVVEQHYIFDNQPSEDNIQNNYASTKNEMIINEIANEGGMGQVLDSNQKDIVQQFINDNSVTVQFENVTEELEGSSQQYHFKNVFNENGTGTTELESDNNHYEIAEEYHITEQTDDVQLQQYDTEPTQHSQGIAECHQDTTIEHTNILKQVEETANNENISKLGKPLMSVKYYLVYPEKENVNSMTGKQNARIPIPRITKPNPRSVLRASFAKPKKIVKSAKPTPNEFPESDIFQKRFAKSKEAVQAKMFYNFINKTTIPQAPVRQTRQPRKQEIKPVSERRDEEIIVQEVMISSNGFVENLNQKFKNKKLQVTAVVELSDSEDEPNSKNRRVSRATSESELSVVEIGSDDEKSDDKCSDAKRTKGKIRKFVTLSSEPAALKRRRGRPPKNRQFTAEVPSIVVVNPDGQKIEPSITAANKIETEENKTEFNCPHCSKSFPSQNSLNTHLIHHNLENSLKNKTKMNSSTLFGSRKSLLPKIEYNHKCSECLLTFKNNLLLQRHTCSAKQNTLNCSVCQKQFRDIAMLNSHKKIHMKANLVKNTSIAKISPRKTLHRPSTSLMKTSKTGFKCKECSKVCDSEVLLSSHMNKMHKKFLCSSCSAAFSSRLLLDTHVRIDCVKIKSPSNKLSYKIRKSFVHTPPKRLSITKKTEKTLNSNLNQSMSSIKFECEYCNTKFSTYRILYTHKVQKHGMNTPDKSLTMKPKQGLYKPKAAHGGIPANDRMKKAFAALRMKLAETQEAVIENTSAVSVAAAQ